MSRHDDGRAGEGRTTATIELPAAVRTRIENRLPRSEFDTVDEYAAFVIAEVLGRVEDATDSEPITRVDREEVETRLEALGYRD
jgi:hypothetical protein